MIRHILAVSVVCIASFTAAVAEEHAPSAKPGGEGMHGGMQGGMMHHDMTLEQAREHAHKKAVALDKMSEEDWAKHQQVRKDRHEKWMKMSPEERDAAMKKHHDMKEKWMSMSPEEKAKFKAEHPHDADDMDDDTPPPGE